MTMLIRIQGDKEVVDWIRGLPIQIAAAVRRRMETEADRISDRIKQKLSGEVLQSKTGALRASIVARMYFSRDKVTLSVGSRGDVPYAAIQEYGGEVSIPPIVPVMASVLAWAAGGDKIYAMRAAAHTVHIPERSYLRSTLEEMLPEMSQMVADGVAEATGRAT